MSVRAGTSTSSTWSRPPARSDPPPAGAASAVAGIACAVVSNGRGSVYYRSLPPGDGEPADRALRAGRRDGCGVVGCRSGVQRELKWLSRAEAPIHRAYARTPTASVASVSPATRPKRSPSCPRLRIPASPYHCRAALGLARRPARLGLPHTRRGEGRDGATWVIAGTAGGRATGIAKAAWWGIAERAWPGIAATATG